MWFVYLLECLDGSFYTGVTNSVEKRMQTHQSGKGSKYVKQKGFYRLLYTIRAVDKVDAMRMEYRIKRLEKNDKVTYFVRHPDRDYSVI